MPASWQTEAEAEMVKRAILLPVLLDLLERDRQALANIPLKMPQIYKGFIGLLQTAAMNELAQVRKDMRKHGIKVFEERRTTFGLEARYLCRGYRYEFDMLWGLVRAEIFQLLGDYSGIDITKEGISP
ncbi:hypothetical protein [Paenibacillus sanguinis]|uniref:hypothetical protein n=1 Tax=Paenibacillus sanguinis TaxID=225906 RepID=UPI00035E187E|nr:hypothetical protein [Paenibacillus sanguinis]